jgi:hypothetical protein
MPEQAALQGRAAFQGGSRASAGPRVPEGRTSSRSTAVGVAGALLMAAAIAGVVMMTGPGSAPSAVAPTSAVALATNVAPALSPVAAPTPAPASANDLAPTSPGMVERTVDSGLDFVLGRPTFWNGACNARGVTVTVTQPPAGGTVSIMEGLNTAPGNPTFGTAGRCAGMQIMGKRVVYRSRPGFHGSDVLAYEYISDLGERATTTVIITVR